MELTCRETQGIFVNMPNVFFSALKRVKTYMRETMGGERLSDLLVICTETACAKNINFEILVASEASAGGEAACACAVKLIPMCRFENSALTHSILIFEKKKWC